MLENLINLVKQHAGDAVINNPAVPNEQNDAVVSEASNSIISGLQNAVSGGNVKDVLSLFSGNQPVTSNGLTQNIQGNFIQNLVGKFGLDQSQAGGIASSLIPMVLQNLVHKTNDPNDGSFNIQNIFNSLSGGGSSGLNIEGLMNKFKGGAFDKDGDGDTDLNDVVAAFSGGKGGGILDTVKGLFS